MSLKYTKYKTVFIYLWSILKTFIRQILCLRNVPTKDFVILGTVLKIYHIEKKYWGQSSKLPNVLKIYHVYQKMSPKYTKSIYIVYIYMGHYLWSDPPPKKSFPIMLKFLQIVALSKVKLLPKAFGWQPMDSLLTEAWIFIIWAVVSNFKRR